VKVRQHNNDGVRLKLGVAAVAAGLAMGAVALASEGQQDGVVDATQGGLAQPTVEFGETSTESGAPKSPETEVASPPVTAEPAPTEEPG